MKYFALILFTLVLSACGGGGGGGSLLRRDVPFYKPTGINHYSPLVTSVYVTPSTEIFAKDLNNDRVDEVVVSSVAFNSQYTLGGWKDSKLQIYGFNSGSFKNETSTWMPGTDSQYLGGTTVRFGDFNGDGKIDVFAATFSDTNIHSSMPVFINNGNNRFTRTNIDFGNVGAHDSIVVDLNRDGYADIVVTDIVNQKPAVAFGSSTGNFTVYRSDTFGGGAGISVADYLGNGTQTIVLTDAPTSDSGSNDTKLFSWSVSNGKLVLTKIADLPPDRFSLSKWSSVVSQSTVEPHAVRNITMDFDNDGRPDVVVFSTMPKNGNTHGYSEVQFLKNNGGGSFTDVTDSVLVNYNTNKTTTYNPQLIDVNNDGLVDILISATDYTGQASTSVLLATKEGKFVESYTQVFSDFANQTKSMSASAVQNQSITIVAGPNGKRYLMTGVETTDSSGVPQIAVYLSLIGSTGTVTAPATVAVIQQAWPWMSASEANEALAKSIVSWVDGMPVLDLKSVMNPIGSLTISLTGRTGTRIPIAGSLSVPGLDSALLTNIQAVDSLNRNFSVNVAGMALKPLGIPIRYNLYTADVTQNWSSRFTNIENHSHNGMDTSGDGQSAYALSFTNRAFNQKINQPWTLRMGMAVLPNNNPWMNISGMFGTIHKTTMLDFNATRFWQNGAFGQIGIIESIVDFTSGLVEKITPMRLGYAVAGWKNNGFTFYGGIQPTIFDGSIRVKLPTSVDAHGTMHYTQHNVAIRNQPVAFVGIDQFWNIGKHLVSVSAVVNDQRSYQTRASFKFNF